MNNNNLVSNIKKLVIFFSICFFSLVVYLTYFDVFVSPNIVDDPANQRIKIDESKILRGSIMDRDGNVIVYSKIEGGKQERIYNYGAEFADVTGYNSYIYGKTAIESAYNNALLGRENYYNLIANFFRGLREFVNNDSKRGNDVYITIDKKLQDAAYKQFGSDKGAAVAINPQTGEILAMISKPSFNPQDFVDNNKQKISEYNSTEANSPLLNRATNGVYPPGSTFKLITTAAALENLNGIDKKTFNDTGALQIGNYTLPNDGNVAHGKIDLEEGFNVSSNFVYGTVGMMLGYDRLESMAERFMFNKPIAFSDEFNVFNAKSGQINTKDPKNPAQTAQDAIGQNMVTANPLDMALVTAAVANNGVMMKPYIVEKIEDRYGVALTTAKPEKLASPISPDIANEIKDFMVTTVKSGTGTSAAIPGITVAGKTGSAQVGNNASPHSWFVAFAPAQNPQIAVAVIVENGGIGGGKAAQVARSIMKTYFNK